MINKLNMFATKNINPDITFILDIDCRIAYDRLKEDIKTFSWARKYSNPTIISKERIDLQRSKNNHRKSKIAIKKWKPIFDIF